MKELVHYLPLPGITYNVRCLNGSAHALRTASLADVTCPLCQDPNLYYDTFWKEKYDKVMFSSRLT